MSRILLIDDYEHFGEFLQRELEKDGHEVEYRNSAEDVPDELADGIFDLVLLDNYMTGMSGLEFLGALQQRDLRLPVILLTGFPSANMVMDAMNLGAYAYVSKDEPELLQELSLLINKALEIDWRPKPVRMPTDPAPDDGTHSELIGISRSMIEVYGRIGTCASSEVPVLIRGETGTGKELVARAIRARGGRKDKPFVVINCAAFNEDQLDDELFGHEPGAFSGADKLHKGGFEHADGGTLFLDEIGNMPLRIQEKLLGALDNSEVLRRGGNEVIKVNIRLLTATRRDLEAAIGAGTFKRELFSRLNGITIKLPTLHERGAKDLRRLVEHFLSKLSESLNRPLPTLHEDAWEKLIRHTWPGNIRELQNVIGRAALLYRGPQITAREIEFDERPSSDGEVVDSIRQAIDAAFRSGQLNLYSRLHGLLNQWLVLLTLPKCGGDQNEAERLLGVPLSEIIPPNPGQPIAPPNNGLSEEELQVKALILIREHPEWTVEQYAEKLGRYRWWLYKDPIIKRALQARGGGR